MILRTVIVEDEPHARERLKDMLAAMPGIEVVAEAEDGAQAIAIIDHLRPELVLLDIEMPGFSGLEVLQRVRHRPWVVFTTAYDQYAIQAFEANAVDYLLKPFTAKRLHQTLERVRERRPLNTDLLLQLQQLLRPREYLGIFSVKNNEEILLIPESKVFFFSAEDKYVFLHTAGRRFFYDATLKELENRLNPEHFLRIHKNAIVAVKQVRKFKRSLMGDFQAVMGDEKNTLLRVGRSFQAAVRSRFGL
ncbi:MAG: response regulator transcription factor [Candidatus Aminicenantes bacterium]|nr:response regulator transcription factor [Candidatus Aminicenantes bacterium]